MSLGREGGHYLWIGAAQWLLDWTVTVAVSYGGAPIAAANIAGRVSGALLGFILNGRITFAGEGTSVGRRQFGRFLMLWLCTTALSTLAMATIDTRLGLRWAWLAKPAVELALGGLGFLASRYWIYRR